MKDWKCKHCGAPLVWADLKEFDRTVRAEDRALFGGYVCIACLAKARTKPEQP